MLALMQVKAHIDISKWWPKDADGKERSVYAVHKDIESNSPQYLVTRHTLTRAKDGQLEKFDAANAVKLARICSYWAGKSLSVDDLIQIEDEERDIST